MTQATKQIDALIGRAGKKKGKGKKGRKIGRQLKSPAMSRYRAEGRSEENRLRRVRRHLRQAPSDTQAREWLSEHGLKEDQAFLAALPVNG